MEKKGFPAALLLGIAVYGLIAGGYLLTRHIFNFGAVTGSLTSGMGITADNFLWVAAYISFINSFLEEFFFRGFGFIALRRYVGGLPGWCFSPALFAIYHGGMMIGMFSPMLLAVLFVGLFVGGLLFNALNARFTSIYPSWFVHMAADLGIMTVGALLFGIL